MTFRKKSRVSDRKAVAAMRLLRLYCKERPCNDECIFYRVFSGVCTLKVKAPENFTTREEKKCKSKSLEER